MRGYTLSGQGTIVTGTALAGSVRVGDTQQLAPGGQQMRVRSIHAQHRAADTGRAGQRLALNLSGVAKDEIARGSWIVSVALSDVGAGQSGQFWFSLDKRLMADVLRGLLPERAQAKKALRGSVRPLASRLQVTLEGRLVSKQVQLGALFDLRVGDVIPVSLSRTDVLLDDSRLFTAAVSEHKGKLCLTSFEDVE